jgi:hypothetical protein
MKEFKGFNIEYLASIHAINCGNTATSGEAYVENVEHLESLLTASWDDEELKAYEQEAELKKTELADKNPAGWLVDLARWKFRRLIRQVKQSQPEEYSDIL